jgi:hypothetical protein
MTDDVSIFRIANLLIMQRGEEAERYALGRADEKDESGNQVSAVTWRKIAEAIKRIQVD